MKKHFFAINLLLLTGLNAGESGDTIITIEPTKGSHQEQEPIHLHYVDLVGCPLGAVRGLLETPKIVAEQYREIRETDSACMAGIATPLLVPVIAVAAMIHDSLTKGCLTVKAWRTGEEKDWPFFYETWKKNSPKKNK
jgi:hypothetical protein